MTDAKQLTGSGGSFPTDPLQRESEDVTQRTCLWGKTGEGGSGWRGGEGRGLPGSAHRLGGPAAKVLSSALWRRQGVGAGHHGRHFSGEGLGRIEREGKATEALPALGL